MCVISLIVYTDKYLGHVRTLYSKEEGASLVYGRGLKVAFSQLFQTAFIMTSQPSVFAECQDRKNPDFYLKYKTSFVQINKSTRKKIEYFINQPAVSMNNLNQLNLSICWPYNLTRYKMNVACNPNVK